MHASELITREVLALFFAEITIRKIAFKKAFQFCILYSLIRMGHTVYQLVREASIVTISV